MRKLIFLATFLCLIFAPFNMQHTHRALAQVRNESVRVATYNAYLLSPFFKCFNPNFADCLLQISGETEKWANHLADTILADPARFDIIVINEAWDEDAKSILVRRLRRQFPNYVRKIDADLIQFRGQALEDILTGQPQAVIEAIFGNAPLGKINGEDSGLMLFARRDFRFLPLPDPAFQWGTENVQTLEATSPEVAFTLFEKCGSADCFSAKGAGLVRLRHLPSDRIYNVVFTHMQADYPEDNEFFSQERRDQFEQIHKLIETTLAPLEQREDELERLLVMGDLNVAGLTSGVAEWNDLFANPASFFSDPIYDTWSRTTSPQDIGITNDHDKDRLDYILAFPEPYQSGGVEGPVCVQHLTIPTNFQDLESDHYMVHADLNLGFHHCHPQIAYEVKLDSGLDPNGAPQESRFIDDENGEDITRINHPGSMQWFHVKKESAGTYSIGVSNNNVKIDVFAPEDLTTPISKYNKVTQTINVNERDIFVETFVLPNEFYIRTSGQTRSFQGDYLLWIKRHNCASKAEACILQPGQRQNATLTKAGNPFGTQNEAWFAFDVIGTSDSGIDQTITLVADKLPNPDNFKAVLEDFMNTSGINPPDAVEEGQKRTFISKMGDGSMGFLVIVQGEPTAENVVVEAQMDTSLRLLDIINLVCMDETNPEFGSDDIFTEFTMDGVTTRAPASGEVEFDCDDSRDEKNWVGAVGKPTITFVDEVGVKVFEEDDISPNDPSHFNPIPTLAADQWMFDGRKNPLVWNFEDGEYQFTFVLRKRANEPVK